MTNSNVGVAVGLWVAVDNGVKVPVGVGGGVYVPLGVMVTVAVLATTRVLVGVGSRISGSSAVGKGVTVEVDVGSTTGSPGAMAGTVGDGNPGSRSTKKTKLPNSAIMTHMAMEDNIPKIAICTLLIPNPH